MRSFPLIDSIKLDSIKVDSMKARAAVALLLVAVLSTSASAAEQKKTAPAPAAHPAAAPPHAAPAAGGAHPGGGAGEAPHGPTPGGGAGHAITTSGTHGPTTGGAGGAGAGSHAITTGGAHAGPTTTTHAGTGETNHTGAVGGEHSAGGERAGAGGAHPGGGEHGSSTFGGRPAPAGSHELHAANGAAVRTRVDGTRSDIHDPKRGMDIHHGLTGNRRVSVERPDHSRIVAERGGHGYVQHPYTFHGHEFGHRTYFEHGRAYDRFYGHYGWHGAYFDVYAPAAFYPYGFYGYAYAPWAVPVAYGWGWNAAPWYGFYAGFYAPYPVYPAPAFWLADFVIAASLQAAYVASLEEAADLNPLPPSPLLEASVWLSDLLIGPAMADAKPAMTQEVKDMVSNEIKALVQQEGNEAQANAAHQDADPGKSSVVQLLSDNQTHVFVAGSDLDLVAAPSGQECALTQGDVLKVTSPPPASGDSESATVIASKGKAKECALATNVTVPMSDLQDMYNHMREQVDDGLGELQSKQGKSGLPAAPAGSTGAPVKAAFAAAAPPPDADAAQQIKAQASQADQAESEAVASVSAAPAAPAAAGSGGSTRIALGESIDVVTAKMGNPTKIIDLGAKKIYTYPDMKIIFQNGKVSDVE